MNLYVVTNELRINESTRLNLLLFNVFKTLKDERLGTNQIICYFLIRIRDKFTVHMIWHFFTKNESICGEKYQNQYSS